MSYEIFAELHIYRTTKKSINNEKLVKQVESITDAPLKRANCPKVEVKRLNECLNHLERKYSFDLVLRKAVTRSETAAIKALENAKKHVFRLAEGYGWNCVDKSQQEQIKDFIENNSTFTVPDLTEDILSKYFGDVYERDAHIRLIHRSVQTALKTNFEERSHTLLYGEPASAKTVLFRRFKEFYEEGGEVERVAIIQSTNISKAGLEQYILDKAKDGILPPILFFDEIEKFKLENMECLLSIMDDSGTISRINAKIGRQQAPAKCLIWATCNDLDKLKSFNSGALWSRFTKTLPCVRPSRDLMYNILLIKLKKREEMGCRVDYRWADAALNYAYSNMRTNDPRKIIGLLEGEDGLLDGSYFRDLEQIEAAYRQSLIL
ncbi:MAG: AAA family ATPase [Bacteroidales bacterium]